jgi:outer membrane cobalamin receptor
MSRAHRVHPSAGVLLIALLWGCAPLHGNQAEGHGPKRRAITAAEIERSGARTAWDAITRLFPSVSFAEDRYGMPTRISRRGASSIHLADVPQIFIDGIRISDFQSLARVPAQDVASIRLLSGLDGTTYYGTNAGDGVIVIRTHSGGE